MSHEDTERVKEGESQLTLALISRMSFLDIFVSVPSNSSQTDCLGADLPAFRLSPAVAYVIYTSFKSNRLPTLLLSLQNSFTPLFVYTPPLVSIFVFSVHSSFL
jgi:hypothetical protein